MGFIERLRRPDWLAEMQSVLIGGLVLLGGGALLQLGLTILGRQDLVVEVPAGTIGGLAGAESGLLGAAEVRPSSTVEVYLPAPDAGQVAADALTYLPSVAVLLVLLFLLLQIVRRARHGQPFSPYVVRRLRLGAIVALVGGSLASMVQAVAALSLAFSVSDDSGFATWPFPLPWILAGFGLLAVAEVVSRGAALRAELDTVI